MISYYVDCDKCGEVIRDASANCIDEAVYDLERIDKKHDNGEELLCDECMQEFSEKLRREDEVQTAGAWGRE